MSATVYSVCVCVCPSFLRALDHLSAMPALVSTLQEISAHDISPLLRHLLPHLVHAAFTPGSGKRPREESVWSLDVAGRVCSPAAVSLIIFYIILYFIILYYILLYYIILYCVLLYFIFMLYFIVHFKNQLRPDKIRYA